MRSRILLVYITAGLAAFAPRATTGEATPAQGQASDPDALYRDREHLASAAEAARVWEGRLRAEPRDYEAAWKLARARHWLGDHEAAAARAGEYERGISAGRAAVAAAPDRPEGHFWLGANMGALAQTGGLTAGLRYRTPIRREFEAVLRLDRGFDQGAGLCALSNYYLRVPSLFGGSKTRAETLARECVAADPQSTLAHYFLAEALVALDRKPEARSELQRVLDVPLQPGYEPEGREWKSRAAAFLARLR